MSHFHFDGTSYITTPTTPDIQVTGKVVVSVYARVPPYTGEWRTFLSTSGQRTGYHLRQGETNANPEMIHADGSWRTGRADMAIPGDSWFTLVGIADPGHAFVFKIDGKDAGGEPISANPGSPETTKPACVGAYIGGATTVDQYMVGDIQAITVATDEGQPPVLVFDAGDTNIPASTPDGTSWVDQRGREWTVVGDGVSLVTQSPVDTTFAVRRGGDTYLGSPTIQISRRKSK